MKAVVVHRAGGPGALREAGERGLELLASGSLRLVVGGRYRLEEAAAAHAFVEERRSVGKGLLTP